MILNSNLFQSSQVKSIKLFNAWGETNVEFIVYIFGRTWYLVSNSNVTVVNTYAWEANTLRRIAVITDTAYIPECAFSAISRVNGSDVLFQFDKVTGYLSALPYVDIPAGVSIVLTLHGIAK